MKKILWLLLLLQTALLAYVLTGHTLWPATSEGAKEVPKAPRAEVIPEIKLAPETARSSGIRVETVGAGGARLSDAAWGTVIPSVGLTESRMRLEKAELDIAQGALLLERTRAEAERLDGAWRDGGNVARKLVDQARRDELEAEQKLKAARRVLETTRESVRAEWGVTLLSALEEPDGGLLAPILRGSAALVLITDAGLDQGQLILAESPSKTATARRLAPAIQVEPGSRKPGAYWIVSSPDFKVGLRVRLIVPRAGKGSLVHVPESAILWQSGVSWVYLEKAPLVFVRSRVVLDEADLGGWTVRSGIGLRDRVVVEGAQLLLSEESKTQIRNENGD